MYSYDNIKVSLIVAIYKSERFLDKLILSILSQTHHNLDIILIDDGSPDASGMICDKFASQDDRITVIHKENGGCCSARNAGLSVAKGEYIAIIDGDDWLESDFVEYLLTMAVETNSEMSMSLSLFTTRDRQQIQEDKKEVWNSEQACLTLIYPKIAIGPWNKLYKRELIKKYKIDFSVPWSGEGYYFSIMSAQYANQVAVGRKKIYNYRLNNYQSGLTNYKVIMGQNALWNTINLKNKMTLKTQRILNAINYHIWSCHYFIVYLILGSDTKKTNKKLYKDCIWYLRSKLFDVILHSELSVKRKIYMVVQAYFTNGLVKYELNKAKAALQKDSMQ